MTLEEYVEKIIQYFTTEEFQGEVRSAKAEFFDKAGIVDENSADFELRMSQFLDWYIFTRKNQDGQTPLEILKAKGGFAQESFEKEYLEQLGKTRHALFEYLKTKGEDVYIKDLLANSKIIIRKSSITLGFTTDEVFDGRIIPVNDTFTFTRGFCFHPPKARKYINREIKRVKKLSDQDKEDMMLKLLKMRYRFAQYKHVEVDEIYTDNPKLKV